LVTARISQREHDDPILVTGDFNAGEENSAMRYLRGEIPRAYKGSSEAPRTLGMRDTYRVVHPRQTEVGTFNGFVGTTTGDKIDAILVSSEWEVQDAKIVRTDFDGRYPSDHFPVVATVAISASQQRTPPR
jgi:endonuclease/exonuclease/phosphatase family metal-dependent hydrolase